MVSVARAKRKRMLLKVLSGTVCLRCLLVSAVGGVPCQGTLLKISKKKSRTSFLAVILRECDGRAEVFKVHCSCKGGSTGHYNHAFALLFPFNDYSCLNIKDFQSDATYTSLPQS